MIKEEGGTIWCVGVASTERERESGVGNFYREKVVWWSFVGLLALWMAWRAKEVCPHELPRVRGATESDSAPSCALPLR